jgi:hypothetical protein
MDARLSQACIVRKARRIEGPPRCAHTHINQRRAFVPEATDPLRMLSWWRKRKIADRLTSTSAFSFAKRALSSAKVLSGCYATGFLTKSVCHASANVLWPPNLTRLTLPVSRLRLMNLLTCSKPSCTTRQLLRGYARIQSPRRRVHAGRRSMASPFTTGPRCPSGNADFDSTLLENLLPIRPSRKMLQGEP